MGPRVSSFRKNASKEEILGSSPEELYPELCVMEETMGLRMDLWEMWVIPKEKLLPW